jgi:GxxExxY protein
LEDENDISYRVIGAALAVQRELGPGLLESIYEQALAYELSQLGIHFQRQQAIPVHYKGQPLDGQLRLDLVVEDRLILELKSVEHIQPIHEAQLLTYLRLSGMRLGLLINFNALPLKHGIRRVVNQL